MLIRIDSKHGAHVGNLQVFTTKGAIDAYKIFCRLFYKHMTMAASVVMDRAAEDLRRLGFDWDQIEAIELEALKEAA